jgi:hypothetical protein
MAEICRLRSAQGVRRIKERYLVHAVGYCHQRLVRGVGPARALGERSGPLSAERLLVPPCPRPEPVWHTRDARGQPAPQVLDGVRVGAPEIMERSISADRANAKARALKQKVYSAQRAASGVA